MSIFRSLAKLGIANKVIQEAKKPANQQKAKDLFAQMKAKRSGKSSPQA